VSTCPLQLRKLRVRTLSVEHQDVSWELEPTVEDVTGYTFQVLRSESAAGPFDPVSDPFVDRYLFVDNAVPLGHRYRQLWYTVRVARTGYPDVWDFGPVSVGHDDDVISIEIRSHIALLMREFIGERCWVLPVRTFGQRCPSCWDTTLKKSVKSNCRGCYGTSFARGYMNPIETWVSIDPSANNEQFTGVGKMQQQDTTARLAYFPAVKPGDLVIDPANSRWVITQATQLKHVGSVVYQEAQLHQVPESSAAHLVELDLGQSIHSMFLKPARTMTNPQDVDNVDDATFNDIMAMYSFNDRRG
jgi:hypothetical protein